MERLPASFADVNKLSAADLSKLCSQFGICLSWPKSVKVNEVCQCLDISTAGTSTMPVLMPAGYTTDTQAEDYLGLTPRVWLAGLITSNSYLHDDSMMKRYLLQAQYLDEVSSTRYQLTRPYQMKDFIHSVAFNSLPSSSLCVVRAMCNPSQSTCKIVKMMLSSCTLCWIKSAVSRVEVIAHALQGSYSCYAVHCWLILCRFVQ